MREVLRLVGRDAHRATKEEGMRPKAGLPINTPGSASSRPRRLAISCTENKGSGIVRFPEGADVHAALLTQMSQQENGITVD